MANVSRNVGIDRIKRTAEGTERRIMDSGDGRKSAPAVAPDALVLREPPEPAAGLATLRRYGRSALRRRRASAAQRSARGARSRGTDPPRAVGDPRSRRAPGPARARLPRRPRAGAARRVGPLGGTTEKGARAEGLHLAHRDAPIGAAAGLLPRRMGAPAPEPQRVLRPP